MPRCERYLDGQKPGKVMERVDVHTLVFMLGIVIGLFETSPSAEASPAICKIKHEYSTPLQRKYDVNLREVTVLKALDDFGESKLSGSDVGMSFKTSMEALDLVVYLKSIPDWVPELLRIGQIDGLLMSHASSDKSPGERWIGASGSDKGLDKLVQTVGERIEVLRISRHKIKRITIQGKGIPLGQIIGLIAQRADMGIDMGQWGGRIIPGRRLLDWTAAGSFFVYLSQEDSSNRLVLQVFCDPANLQSIYTLKISDVTIRDPNGRSRTIPGDFVVGQVGIEWTSDDSVELDGGSTVTAKISSCDLINEYVLTQIDKDTSISGYGMDIRAARTLPVEERPNDPLISVDVHEQVKILLFLRIDLPEKAEVRVLKVCRSRGPADCSNWRKPVEKDPRGYDWSRQGYDAVDEYDGFQEDTNDFLPIDVLMAKYEPREVKLATMVPRGYFRRLSPEQTLEVAQKRARAEAQARHTLVCRELPADVNYTHRDNIHLFVWGSDPNRTYFTMSLPPALAEKNDPGELAEGLAADIKAKWANVSSVEVTDYAAGKFSGKQVVCQTLSSGRKDTEVIYYLWDGNVIWMGQFGLEDEGDFEKVRAILTACDGVTN